MGDDHFGHIIGTGIVVVPGAIVVSPAQLMEMQVRGATAGANIGHVQPGCITSKNQLVREATSEIEQNAEWGAAVGAIALSPVTIRGATSTIPMHV